MLDKTNSLSKQANWIFRISTILLASYYIRMKNTYINSEGRLIILLSEFSALTWALIYFSERRSPSDNRFLSGNHRLTSYIGSDHRIRISGTIIVIINVYITLSNENIVSVIEWWLWIFCKENDEYVLYMFIFYVQNILSMIILCVQCYSFLSILCFSLLADWYDESNEGRKKYVPIFPS